MKNSLHQRNSLNNTTDAAAYEQWSRRGEIIERRSLRGMSIEPDAAAYPHIAQLFSLQRHRIIKPPVRTKRPRAASLSASEPTKRLPRSWPNKSAVAGSREQSALAPERNRRPGQMSTARFQQCLRTGFVAHRAARLGPGFWKALA